MTYGLVFRIHNEVFLAEYDDVGNIQDGDSIGDPKGIYDSLTENELSFVEVHSYQQDVQYLKDLKKISVKNDEDPTKTFFDLLKEGGGPEIAKSIYDDIIGHVA